MDKEELINGYFEGSLSQDQLMEFNRLLEANSEFASEFKFQKEIQVSLKKEKRQDLKALFNDLDMPAEKPEARVFQLRQWLIAASVALLVGLGSWFLFFNSADIDTDELYAVNFAPYDNVIHPIERGDQTQDLKTRAFIAYENREYPKALELFEELGAKQNDSYLDFYSAMALMQLNKLEEAIPLLQGHIAKEGELKDRAIWYLALAHLKMSEVEKAKIELTRLVDEDGFKATDAKKLLNVLN